MFSVIIRNNFSFVLNWEGEFVNRMKAKENHKNYKRDKNESLHFVFCVAKRSKECNA